LTDVSFEWTWKGEARHKSVRINVPEQAAADTPVVLLLHGANGDANVMSDPAVVPGFNVERVAEGTIRDHGWHPYPNVGWWSLGVDSVVPVEGWEPFLNGRDIPTLNYAQDGARGSLAESAAELRRLLEVLEEQRTGNLHPDFAEVADRRIMLMGYSRGGILARQVLVDLKATDAPVLRRISNCIELHAPNQGSNLGSVAAAVDGAATALRAAIEALVIPPPVKNVALGWLARFLDLLHADLGAHGDYAVGSQVLRELAEAEPVPGVEYFTFGGTRPVLLNVRGWAFTPGSALPQWHEPPFHWRSAYQALLPIPPPLPLPVSELTDGVGDMFVVEAAARLPFSVHRHNHISHAECLWDNSLKIQVAAILDSAPLSDPLVVECVIPDASDPDRTLDGLRGPSPAGGMWRLTLAEALAVADGGSPLFVRRPDDRLVPLQRVRRRDGRRYLRTLPGADGPRLLDLERCL
jgi:hypothetical protein